MLVPLEKYLPLTSCFPIYHSGPEHAAVRHRTANRINPKTALSIPGQGQFGPVRFEPVISRSVRTWHFQYYCAGASAQKIDQCAKEPIKQVSAARGRITANRNRALDIRRKRMALVPRVDLSLQDDMLEQISHLSHHF